MIFDSLLNAMKICPKCGSAYSDETLNFCLADGEPLAEGTVSVQNIAVGQDDWRDAETLLDYRPVLDEQSRQTSAGNSVPTLPLVSTPTQEIPAKSNRLKIYLPVGLLIGAGLLAGHLWYSQSKNQPAANTNQPASVQTPAAKPAANLTADEQNLIKKEITDNLEAWRKSIEDRNLDKHLEFYANTLDFFYKDSNINKNYVRAARARAYEVYQTLSLQIDKLKVTPESETTAMVTFDKDWTFKNSQKTSTGSVQQEMHLSKQNGKWLITAEKDLEVHFINNRTNDSANVEVPVPPAQP